ncbi:MAG: glutamate racemase [Ignavibacteria bacterium GWB2_35_12]|nr:MAG: glutamate racemase [Ignavibacteria bacterium GWA2_35_8]OGU38810.1 MAG: glutamate racemase [Ignavibacteria bacterium GWB2_35_12]OGU88530.1 MAG: glutamate racemase [Ignavibacteria bacterium RIFOXYA2_FULL_35_10]OGV20280.1 MAG: glutamate racemase [Ignavibacteria bacterium RIFOXYC2_FULL_35_21]
MDMKNNPIGVFDSGIGGLSVLKQFIRFLPFERYVYLGDTARVPYGNRSPETVKRYAKESTRFLLEHDVKLIVVACNTVSSVALDVVRELSTVPVIGMIYPAAVAALRATVNKKIGVIGTRATINSNAYSEEINKLSNGDNIKVISQACPLFVPIIEEGWLEHPATRLISEEYLSGLKAENIDTLVLGCTHYPLLKQLLTEMMPGISLVDSGEHAAVMAVRMLAEQENLVEEKDVYVQKPGIEFFVTDIPSTFFDIAQKFLGFTVESPKIVSLSSLIK